jgi:hypothetical protein
MTIGTPWVLSTLLGCAGIAACSPPRSESALTPPLDSLLAAGAIDTSRAAVWTDSAAGHPEGDIYRLWARYLAENARTPGRGCRPSDRWVRAERERWQCYALALLYVPRTATAHVLSIRAEQGRRDVYRILTLFRSDSARSALRSATTLMTVFAVHADSAWLLANALPRFTSDWRREKVGPITYVMPPDYAFRRARAEAAVRFADSLAIQFGVPRLGPLTYFLLPSVDDVYRIMGLQTPHRWGPGGGVAQPGNHLLFSGDPGVGEDYRHELTHVVLGPIAGSPLAFVTEAVPTWLGGTSGMSYAVAAESLAIFLRANPNITLDSLIEGRFHARISYAAGAVLAAMIFDRGGVSAVKSFYMSPAGPKDMRLGVERLFQQPWAAVEAMWRARTLAFVAAEPARSASGGPSH